MQISLSNFFTPALGLFGLLVASIASAAPAVVCRSATGEVTSAVPYAFAEANARKKMQFVEAEEPFSVQLETSMQALIDEGSIPADLAFARAAELRASLRQIDEKTVQLSAGSQRGQPVELGEAPLSLPSGCAVELVSNFESGKGYWQIGEVISQFNETQKAAVKMQDVLELTAIRMQASRGMFPDSTWESMSDARKRYVLDTSAAVAKELSSRVRRMVALLYSRVEGGSSEEIRRDRQLRENANVLLSWAFRKIVVVPREHAASLRMLVSDTSLTPNALRCGAQSNVHSGDSRTTWQAVPAENTSSVRAFRTEGSPCRYLSVEGEREIRFVVSFGESKIPLTSYEPIVLYY